MKNELLCISVWQPWAELIIAGIKPVENRTWFTNYKGPLLIHAALRWDAGWEDKLCWLAKGIALTHLDKITRIEGACGRYSLPQGRIVGAVCQTNCCEPHEDFGIWHQQGFFGHIYKNPIRFRAPTKIAGMLKLFKVNARILSEIDFSTLAERKML